MIEFRGPLRHSKSIYELRNVCYVLRRARAKNFLDLYTCRVVEKKVGISPAYMLYRPRDWFPTHADVCRPIARQLFVARASRFSLNVSYFVFSWWTFFFHFRLFFCFFFLPSAYVCVLWNLRKSSCLHLEFGYTRTWKHA